jgi:hypothetical protein
MNDGERVIREAGPESACRPKRGRASGRRSRMFEMQYPSVSLRGHEERPLPDDPGGGVITRQR